MDYVVSTLKELVELKTDSVEKSNYVEMSDLLGKKMKEAGAKVKAINAKAPDGKPRPNLIGYIDNGGDETVALNAHYDAMPVIKNEWKTDPFKLVIKGKNAYGRGASDDKSGIAVALSAALSSKGRTNLELIFTCDEEVGSTYGAKYLLEKHRKEVRSRHAVVLDTDRGVCVGCSGIIVGSIVVEGKEAHAGFPFYGKNAIKEALPFLAKIQNFEEIAARQVSEYYGNESRKVYGRFNITVLNAGFKSNFMPGRLDAKFDMRSTPEVSAVALQKSFSSYFEQARREFGVSARLQYDFVREGYLTDPKSVIVRKLIKATGAKRMCASFGGTDGTHFAKAGIPVVGYGAENESMHKSNEYVNLDELIKVRDDVVAVLDSF